VIELHRARQGVAAGPSSISVRCVWWLTVATISAIGLVPLPGMMTGVILGGGNPMTAIKYQIAIFTGTAQRVIRAFRLTAFSNITNRGTLDCDIFQAGRA
jgi:putative ABC transport system permease protein